MKIPTLSLLNPSAESRGTEGRPSQGETLDRLGLKTGESRLARLLAGSEATGNTARNTASRLLLEINGQQIPVRSEQGLQAGSLVRVMRAGNELQLMEMVGSPGRSTLSQSLAHRIPSQHHLGEGLSQLLNRQPDGSVPEPARQTLQKLLQMLPRLNSGTSPTTGQNPGQTAQAGSQTPFNTLLASQSPTSTPAPGGGNQVSLAPPEAINAERVRDWLSSSGLFREARLITAPSASPLAKGQSSEPGANDLKAQLIRLVGQLLPAAAGKGSADSNEAGGNLANLSALRPATTPELTGQDALRFPAPIPPSAPNTASAGGAVSSESISAGETLRLLAGMINRITVNQLHSQAASTTGADGQTVNQTWILELPWVTSNSEVKLLQGRLEERGEDSEGDDGNGGGGEREWRLNLALELDATGPIYFDVALKGRQLSTTVWAELQATASLVRQTRNHLETALARLDLDVKPVECLQGKPPAMVTKLSQQLVDEHA